MSEVDDSDWESFDRSLGVYLQDLFNAGGSKSLAASTLHGLVMFLPQAKGRLLIAQKMVRNWHRAEPAVPYPPLSWSTTVSIALRMVARGLVDYGVATLLAFDCYLRVSELTCLLREDVAEARDERLGLATTVLRLANTKTGTEQSVVLENSDVAAILKGHLARVPSSSCVFRFDSANYRRCFKATCADLGLSPDYVPHSLRHGGATRSYLLGRSVEAVMERGRWAVTKSARRYIQAGRALLVKMQVPRGVTLRGEAASKCLVFAFDCACRMAPQGHSPWLW